MQRTRFVIVAAAVAMASAAAAAQETVPSASRPRFSEEAISHAVSRVASGAATPRGPTSQTGAAAKADANRSWNALVGSVAPGRKLIVTLADSTRIEGTLLGVDANSILIQQPAGPRAIQMTDVVRVGNAGVRRRHAFYGMLIGSLAGAVALVAIDQRSSHPSTKVEAAAMGAAVIGLPVGALVGSALPVGPPLYEAANPVRKTP